MSDLVADSLIAEGQRELAERELSRRRLLPFTKTFVPKYQAGWFHKDLCLRLEQFSSDVIAMKEPRLILTVPPRHGKSEVASRRFPAWHLGRAPDHEFIACSYSGTLAMGFSRAVRGTIREPAYQHLFGTRLDPDSQSVETWRTVQGGGYLAAGVGGPITGNGAHILLIDDPVKNREDAESAAARRNLWDWYTSTAYTRLAPGGGVILIMCMTGDTAVRMADGTERPLRDIRAGDVVAGYEDGQLTSARVLNWINQGPDSVFRITTASGRISRANRRHPFLVLRDGELEWVRLRDLLIGDQMVALPAGRTSGRLASSRDASGPRSASSGACRTTTGGAGLRGIARRLLARIPRLASARSSSIATASRWMTIAASWLIRTGAAQSVAARRQMPATLNIGTTCSASITATILARSAACCATTATWLLAGVARLNGSKPLPRTSDFTLDPITAIEPDGREDVFDIQVERTENFIANGVVSHNTRWHDDDLAGRLIDAQKDGGDEWQIVNYPAIAEEDEAFRKKGAALHPDRYPIKRLRRIRSTIGPRDFNALYQQKPIADEGDYFNKGMFRFYKPMDLPDRSELRFYCAWDLAIGQKEVNDYTVGGCVGIDRQGRMWLVDFVRKRLAAQEMIEEILDMQRRWNAELVGMEHGQIKMSIGPFLNQQIQRRRQYNFALEELKPGRVDKMSRARTIQGLMQQAMVLFPDPDGTPWVWDILNELLRFPYGVHDDIADMLSWLGLMVEKYIHGVMPGAMRPPKTWKDRLTGALGRSRSGESAMSA